NGHITFHSSWYSYIPQMFPMHGTRDIIAPFWTDFDNRKTGWVYYNQYTSGSLNFNASLVFVATWYEMAYYPNSGTETTVQAVLISDGQYSFVLMNYGIIAGYDTVHSSYHFTIPGSFSNNGIGNNSSFRQSSNVNELGRWAFRVDNGTRGPLYPIAGTTTARALDGSSPLISLQHPFVYFGQTYNQIYVCKKIFSKLIQKQNNMNKPIKTNWDNR
uniref:NIDO domain-containing protein n=1 Tax=Labrus bergylta TaxID=56723 RepID=A0A3Q3G5M0_9LABR